MSDFKLISWGEKFFELLSRYIEIDKKIKKMKIQPSKYRSVLCENDCNIYRMFYSLYINVPTPFVKGDILDTLDGRPFVFLPRKTLEDYKVDRGWYDMCPRGYMLNERNYTIQVYLMEETYLNFDYYKGKLKGKERILKLLSNYYQNIFDPVILLNTYASLVGNNAEELESWSWIHNVNMDEVEKSNILKTFPICKEELKQLPF